MCSLCVLVAIFQKVPILHFHQLPHTIHGTCTSCWRNPLSFNTPGCCALLIAFLLIHNSTLDQTCIYAYKTCCVTLPTSSPLAF
jgi:hypothetical protein